MTTRHEGQVVQEPRLAKYKDILQKAHQQVHQELTKILRLQHNNQYKEVLELKNYIELITRLRRKLDLLHKEAMEGRNVFDNKIAVEDFLTFVQRFGLDAIQRVYNPNLQIDEQRMARTAIDETTLNLLGQSPLENLTESLTELLSATRKFLT